MKKEVTIAGGGLAGLALGTALRKRNVPVTLHEAGRYPHHRVCGEFICGVGDEVLSTLGIMTCFSDAVICRDTSWFYNGRMVYKRRLPTSAIGISRFLLDKRLADHFVQNGGELIQNSRLSSEALLGEGTVCATGRKAARSDWLGLKFHLHDLSLESDLELHLGSGAYLGLSRIENGVVNACGLFKKRSHGSVSREDLPFTYLQSSGFEYLMTKLQKAELDPASITGIAALNYKNTAPSNEGVVAIGDYAGLIPPFTGNGMSIAFEAASLTIDPIVSWSDGEMSWPDAGACIKRFQARAFASRKRIARFLHPLMYRPDGQHLLSLFARGNLLPFNPLFNLTH